MDKNEKKIIKLEEKIKQTLNEIDEKWRNANSEYKNSPEYDRKRFENEIMFIQKCRRTGGVSVL